MPAAIENGKLKSGDLLKTRLADGQLENRPAPGEPFNNPESSIDNCPLAFARWLLIAVLVGAPWALGGVVPWARAALGLAACLILFLWGLGSVRQGVLTLAWSPLYVPLGLFIVLGVVQYAAKLTLDRSETRQALVGLAVDAVFFFVTVQLFSTAPEETWRAFGLAVLALAGSLGLFAILEFAAGEQRIYGNVVTPGNLLFGPYVNPNHFAGLIEMLIPVAVLSIPSVRQVTENPRAVDAEGEGKPALRLGSRLGRSSTLALLAWVAVGAAVAVASLLLSGSRGGLLALGAEVAIALGVRGWRAHRSPRREKGAGLAAGLAATTLAAVLLFTWVDPGVIAHRLALIVKVGGPAWVEWAGFRRQVASDSLRMLRDHPLSGVGMGNFQNAYPRYQSFATDLWIDHAHNDYVEAMAETGLPGALLMLAALMLFLRIAFRPGFRHPELRTSNSEPRLPTPALATRHLPLATSAEGSLICLGAALGCCGMLVHSFFDFNLHIPANAAWFAVLAGIAATNGAYGESWSGHPGDV